MYTGTPATRSGAEWPVRVPSPSCPKLLLPHVHTEVAAEMPLVRVATEAWGAAPQFSDRCPDRRRRRARRR